MCQDFVNGGSLLVGCVEGALAAMQSRDDVQVAVDCRGSSAEFENEWRNQEPFFASDTY